MTATAPVRAEKSETTGESGDIAALRDEARALGINSFSLSRQALKASIAAVNDAVARLKETATAPSGNEDGPRADALGEPLGPENIQRIPMGTRSTRLGGDQRSGFYRRWFNDVYGRIERARKAGYEHVNDGSGQPRSAPAGTQEQGGGLRAYFMEIPQHLRDQDLQQKRSVNDDIDRMLNRGKIKDQPGDNRYVPDTGISISRR